MAYCSSAAEYLPDLDPSSIPSFENLTSTGDYNNFERKSCFLLRVFLFYF